MGVLLAMIRWERAPQAIEQWAKMRTIRDKLRLVEAKADLAGAHYRKFAVLALDAFTSLSKKRSKLAHGFFGIVTDRENQFAWRKAGSAASRMATDLASPSTPVSPKPPTLIYTPKDFAEIVQGCADTCEKIDVALEGLPIVHGAFDPL